MLPARKYNCELVPRLATSSRSKKQPWAPSPASSAAPPWPVTPRASTCSARKKAPLSLVVVPTPIGNLEDITLRALRYLREADLIACEDTRRTGRLLAHYGIKKPLLSFHEHNEERLAPDLAGKTRAALVALVSDAGTPLVSDPGYRLLRACIEAGVEIEVLPGPSAAMTALIASGLPAVKVVFFGFPPRQGRK